MTRIGTWNLQGARSRPRIARQLRFMEREACDIWLLTEVSDAFSSKMELGRSALSGRMTPDKAYAAVWATDEVKERAPIHEAAAFATVGELRVCSCVLPWRNARPEWPDKGADLAAVTRTAIRRLRDGLALGSGDLVWGGDWNQALEGRDHVGTRPGRAAVGEMMTRLDLQAPTSHLAHMKPGMRSIDHIAFPTRWHVQHAWPRPATDDDGRLSDHDAYVVEVNVC